MAKVLVTMEHADGVAAIVRTWRGMWLAGYGDQPSALIDDDAAAVEGLDGERTAQGGRLPPGAVGAEVVDDAGRRHTAAAANGAWVVVLDQPVIWDANPVRFLDAAGATVPVPAPAGPRTPVPDAPEPCPACGASSWDQLVPGEKRLVGGASSQPGPLAVCRTCGHAEEIGTFYSPLPDGEEPPWPEEEGLREGEAALAGPDRAESARLALAEARFPVYAVSGRPAEVAGWGRDREGVNLVELVHAGPPRLTVTTERRVLWGEAWINAQERERRRLAATARTAAGEMSIDGAPARFEIATAEIGWAGVRRHGDLLITVAARGCAPAEIELDPLVS